MQNIPKSQTYREETHALKPVTSKNQPNRAWIEVNHKNIELNTLTIKKVLLGKCLLMAVVKADGYGHGAVTVAKAAIKGGANQLGVATLQEGIELREAGIESPILVLGNLIDLEELKECLNWKLMPTISNAREANICNEIAKIKNETFPIHIKFDTGMSRLGCSIKEAPKLINLVNNFSNLCLKGLYSHLALADEEEDNNNFTNKQKEIFEKLILSITQNRIYFHLANSAGTLINKEMHYDMVRVGLAIYGYNPLKDGKNHLELKPALSVKAKITLIRDVPKGVGVSYGHNFITQRPSRLAVVGIGYADGINRSLSGKISVICNGNLFPQVGAITMDQMIIDITNSSEIEVGNVVTLIGIQGKQALSVNEWATLSGLIPWEILCGFKHRLPRVVI